MGQGQAKQSESEEKKLKDVVSRNEKNVRATQKELDEMRDKKKTAEARLKELLALRSSPDDYKDEINDELKKISRFNEELQDVGAENQLQQQIASKAAEAVRQNVKTKRLMQTEKDLKAVLEYSKTGSKLDKAVAGVEISIQTLKDRRNMLNSMSQRLMADQVPVVSDIKSRSTPAEAKQERSRQDLLAHYEAQVIRSAHVPGMAAAARPRVTQVPHESRPRMTTNMPTPGSAEENAVRLFQTV